MVPRRTPGGDSIAVDGRGIAARSAAISGRLGRTHRSVRSRDRRLLHDGGDSALLVAFDALDHLRGRRCGFYSSLDTGLAAWNAVSAILPAASVTMASVGTAPEERAAFPDPVAFWLREDHR